MHTIIECKAFQANCRWQEPGTRHEHPVRFTRPHWLRPFEQPVYVMQGTVPWSCVLEWWKHPRRFPVLFTTSALQREVSLGDGSHVSNYADHRSLDTRSHSFAIHIDTALLSFPIWSMMPLSHDVEICSYARSDPHVVRARQLGRLRSCEERLPPTRASSAANVNK